MPGLFQRVKMAGVEVLTPAFSVLPDRANSIAVLPDAAIGCFKSGNAK